MTTGRERVEVVGEPAAEWTQLAVSGEARGEEAGVDGTGDRWDGRHGGDHGDAEHVDDVSLGQGSAGFGDDDNAVQGLAPLAQERSEGEIARSPEHTDAALTWPHSAQVGMTQTAGVHDAELGMAGRGLGQPEAPVHGLALIRRRGDAEQGRHRVEVVGEELGGDHGAGPQGEHGGDRAGPSTATSADQRDRRGGAVAGADGRGLHQRAPACLHHTAAGWLGRGGLASPTVPPLLDLGGGHCAASSSQR
jgi:hypothetical protein